MNTKVSIKVPSWVYRYKVGTIRDIADHYGGYCPNETNNLETIELKVDFDNALQSIRSTLRACVFRSEDWLLSEKEKALKRMRRKLNRFGGKR